MRGGDDGPHRLLLEATGQEGLTQQGGGALSWVVRPMGGLPSTVGAHHPGEGPSKEDDRHHGGNRGDDRQGRSEGGTHASTLLGARSCGRGRILIRAPWAGDLHHADRALQGEVFPLPAGFLI